ncbi:MAG: ATP-binding protein [Ignavibacteriae bacterium]|nr:ATP-binding protein [Ignavibacteriota bacterium]MCB9217198.1 ATP-binding protein [Ignavibacteria bacterium]
MKESSFAKNDLYAIHFTGEYRSLVSFQWDDIPPFAIVTGVNGVGKSHFVDLLSLYPLSNSENVLDIRIPDESKTSEIKVVRYRSEYKVNADYPFTLATIHQRQQQTIQDYRNSKKQNNVSKQIIGVDNSIDHSDDILYSAIEANPENLFTLADPREDIAIMSMLWKQKQHSLYKKRVPYDEIDKQMGESPWKYINDVLRDLGFDFKISGPVDRLGEDIYLENCTSVSSGKVFNIKTLSSGEQQILGLLAWLVRCNWSSTQPDILVMDEPDAHLHPSLTEKFVRFLTNIIVDEYGIRVIMTTHSPSTVALVNESAVFEMMRQKERIVKPRSKWNSIRALTSGLVTIGDDTQYVFVEDVLDAQFYSVVWQAAINRSSTNTAPLLSNSPNLLFLDVSLSKKGEQVPGGAGGRNKVIKIVNSVHLPNFWGLIDNDNTQCEVNRIFQIQRYEIENYLLDPVNFAAALWNSQGLPPSLKHIEEIISNPYQMKELNALELQSVINAIVESLSKEMFGETEIDKSLQDVRYQPSLILKYPKWFLSSKGKNFLGPLRKIYNARSITFDSLLTSYPMVGLIPNDLIEVLRKIQAGQTS